MLLQVERRKTMISSLPDDLIEDILARVPLKSMRSVRLTCTKWNTLSKSQSFAKMHIDKAPAAESQMIVMKNEKKLYLMNVVVDGDPAPKSELICLDEQVKISKVFHCEGLLLCMLKEDDTKVLVWNPYCGQKTWIETRYSQGWGHSRRSKESYNYAIGYANSNGKSCRSYKILRIFDDDLHLRNPDRFSWYETYDLDTGLWTTLDVSPATCIVQFQCGVFLKGNTYWVAYERNLGYGCRIICLHSVICFDFARERFGPPSRLPFAEAPDDYYVTLSSVREERLAIMKNYDHYQIDIWITTKIEVEEISWSKFLTLNATKPDESISSRSFYIDEEKKVAMGFGRVICDGWKHREAGYLKKLDLRELADNNNWLTYGCSYVPSFVQVKQPAGDKRKRQSDLEKRRYDEKMSRLAGLLNEEQENN